MTGYNKFHYEPQHEKTNKMSVRPAKTQISLGIRHFLGFVMSRLLSVLYSLVLCGSNQMLEVDTLISTISLM